MELYRLQFKCLELPVNIILFKPNFYWLLWGQKETKWRGGRLTFRNFYFLHWFKWYPSGEGEKPDRPLIVTYDAACIMENIMRGGGLKM